MNQGKKPNGIRSLVAIATFIFMICGMFVWVGFWKAEASANTETVHDHETRIRAVEDATIRTDERLTNIEKDIDEILEEVRK